MRVVALALVVVFAIASVSLTVTDTGCGCKTTINIAPPQMVNREDIDNRAWDVTLHINKMTPKDERVLWRDVRIVVRSMEGRVLDGPSQLSPDDPAGHYPFGTWDTIVRFWYVEEGGNHRIDAGDAIVLSGIGSDYEGAIIDVLEGREPVGQAKLPIVFD